MQQYQNMKKSELFLNLLGISVLIGMKMNSFGLLPGCTELPGTLPILTKQSLCMHQGDKPGPRGLLIGLIRWRELSFSCSSLLGNRHTKVMLKVFVTMLWEFRSHQKDKLIWQSGDPTDMHQILHSFVLG